jgi:hypothetical protein
MAVVVSSVANSTQSLPKAFDQVGRKLELNLSRLPDQGCLNGTFRFDRCSRLCDLHPNEPIGARRTNERQRGFGRPESYIYVAYLFTDERTLRDQGSHCHHGISFPVVLLLVLLFLEHEIQILVDPVGLTYENRDIPLHTGFLIRLLMQATKHDDPLVQATQWVLVESKIEEGCILRRKTSGVV